MNKAFFLDRDGVLNKTIFRMGKARAPYKIDELILCDRVTDGLMKLKEQGYLLIVVTNQPDVKRGWVSQQAVYEVNNRLLQLLPLDDILICFHDNDDDCLCRKPRPGMLLEAASKWQIDLSHSYMVGDRSSDIEAGYSAGCRTILIGDEKCDFADYSFETLYEATLNIL